MRFTYEEIKKEIQSQLQEIQEHNYPEDYLSELADGFLPIYNNEVIRDWTEMPNEYDDKWKELGMTGEDTIISLMRIDLYFYYLEQTEIIYRELTRETEGVNA